MIAYAILFFLAICVYGFFIFRTRFTIEGKTWFTLIDDAMISMRYAKNLALGYGFVWNIGEPPIQGFSNPLWTGWMTLIHLIGFSESKRSLVIMLSSAILLLLNAITMGRITQKMVPEDRAAPLIATALTLFFYPLVFWSLRGLEVGLITSLISMFCLQIISTILSPRQPTVKHIAAIVITASLAVVTRFDTVIQIFCGLLFLALYHRKAAMKCTAMIACSVIGVLIAQFLYFGDFLPNTYYLKIAGIPIVDRMHQGLCVAVKNALPAIIVPCILSAAALALHADLRRKETLFLITMFFIQLAYSIWIGGDYAEQDLRACNRFITQGAPFLFCICAIAASRLSGMLLQNRQQSLQGMAITLVIAASLLVPVTGTNWKKWVLTDAEMLVLDIMRVQRGHMISMSTDEKTVIAVHGAGNIPYYAQRTTIDLLGKSDHYIARMIPKQTMIPGHNRWDYEFSIGVKRPDLVADDWGNIDSFMSENMIDQYQKLSCGMYVRMDSKYVQPEWLSCDVTR